MKKIDKRACRKFDTQKLQIRPNHGLLHAPGVAYIVRTTVQSIGKKRLLVLCYFSVDAVLSGNTEPKYVTFQGKDDFITLEHLENGKTKWRLCASCWLESFSTDMDRKCAFYSGVDERKVMRFTEKTAKTGFAALYQLQSENKRRREHERKEQKKQRIAKLMKPIDRRPLPKGLSLWIEREVIPVHIYYEYRKGKKIQNGYCTRCKTDVQVESPRHAKKGVCPNCKAEVTFHATGRNSRIHERETVQVVQRVGTQLVIRVVKAYMSFIDYRKPNFSVSESARFLCDCVNGKYKEREFYREYGTDPITNWRDGSCPVMSQWRYSFRADNCAYLYTRTVAKELKSTPWQYCQVDAFCEHFGKPLYLPSYLHRYTDYPFLEYLIKLKLFCLAKETVYGSEARGLYHKNPLNFDGKSMQEVLGVGKEHLPMLQRLDINAHGLYLFQKMLAAKRPIEETFLGWCQDSGIYDDQDILRCLRYGTQKKLQSYIAAQAEILKDHRGNSHAFHLYKDYIRFCEDLSYDLTDEFILYPRNVQQAHDEASKMFDRKKVQIYNDKILGDYPALAKKFRMSKKGMIIVPPKSAEEIVAEGQALHHCVGGYVSRVASNETVILFLREKKQPDTPFYTIEVKNGEVAQVRGRNNCRATPKVESYMELWKQEKLLPAMKKAA